MKKRKTAKWFRVYSLFFFVVQLIKRSVPFIGTGFLIRRYHKTLQYAKAGQQNIEVMCVSSVKMK